MKTSRPVEVLVLAVQEEGAPEEREYHEVDPEVVGRVGERVVVFEPAEVGQQILPIMPLDFLPGEDERVHALLGGKQVGDDEREEHQARRLLACSSVSGCT